MSGGPEEALQRIRSLTLTLTGRCNLDCSYCYQDQKRPSRMSQATLSAALDLAIESASEEVSVAFVGGEPLLELPLIEHAVAYLRAHTPAGKRVRLAISTNGTLLRSAAPFLAEHRIRTQLSFDGSPAAQAFRGPRTFPIVDAQLAELRRDYPRYFRDHLQVAITVHSGNIPHLADAVDHLLDRGVASIGFLPLFTHDPGWRHAHRGLMDAQFSRIFARALDNYHRSGEIPVDLFHRGRGRRQRPAERAMCGIGGGTTLAVGADGRVSGCVTFSGELQRLPAGTLGDRLRGLALGALGNAGLRRRLSLYPAQIGAAGLFDHQERKHSSYGRCATCRYLADCRVCPVSIAYIPGNADPDLVPDHACAFHLVTQSWRGRFPAQQSLAEALVQKPPRLVRQLEARLAPRPQRRAEDGHGGE